MTTQTDTKLIDHPDHYTVGGIETIDFIKAKLTPEQFEGYLVGNLLKYVARANHKGSKAQDYAKAAWYADALVNEVSGNE